MKPIQIKNNITYATVEKHLKRVKEDEEKEIAERRNNNPFYSSYFNVRFYEWSNLNSTPKIFQTSFAFFQFLKECNISYTDTQRSMVYAATGVVYATCKYGEASLLVGSTMGSLKVLLDTSHVTSVNLPAVVNNG